MGNKKGCSGRKVLSLLLSLLLLTGLVPAMGTTAWAETSGDYGYKVLDDGTAEIAAYTGTADVLEIPGEIDGYKVTSIRYETFKGCTSLTEVEIPASVTNIGRYAFEGCTNLTEFRVEEGNSAYSSENGVLFDKDKSVLIQCSKEKSGSYTIPSSVARIEDGAFKGCASLAGVEIPSSVISIDHNAFRDCTSLIKVEIPNSVTSMGCEVFYGCISLTEVKIPAGVTGIGDYTFYGCTSLTKIEIPAGVTYINHYAFEGCTSLTEVVIPAGVTSIGNRVFYGCTNLTEIRVEEGNSAYFSENGVLFNKDKSVLMQYPGGKSGSYTIPASVTQIEEGAFYGCASLTEVVIPASVTSIESGTFEGCTSLVKVEIPAGVTRIGYWTFRGCTSLAKVEIPAGMTGIENGTFEGCTSLAEIVIPASVTRIGDDAFYGCTSLAGVDIPSSVTDIGSWAFRDCTSLTEVEIPAGVTDIGDLAFYGCTNLTEIRVEEGNSAYSSENGVLFNKDKSVLLRCPGGKSGSYTIPAGVTRIEGYAFSNCTSLTEVEIPDSVTHIERYAFSGCTSLTEVEIPASATDIGHWAFSGCTNLTEIRVEEGNSAYSSENGVLFNKDKSILMQCPEGKSGSYTIPSSVTRIEGYAFYSCTSLAEVEIPDSVTSIGKYAFGYNWDDDGDIGKLENFTIIGYPGTAAETYANENGFIFIDITTQLTDPDTGITVSESETNAIPDGAQLRVETVSQPSGRPAYDITLVTAGGDAVQPSGEVRVSLPVPAAMDASRCKVYRLTADGETDMQAVYEDGKFTFVTNLLGVYLIEEEGTQAVIPGDMNGDGQITIQDVMEACKVLARQSAGTVPTEEEMNRGDLDGDQAFTISDVMEICKILARQA